MRLLDGRPQLRTFMTEGLIDLQGRFLDLERRCQSLEAQLADAVEKVSAVDLQAGTRQAKKRRWLAECDKQDRSATASEATA
jgi:hypothetical protein